MNGVWFEEGTGGFNSFSDLSSVQRTLEVTLFFTILCLINRLMTCSLEVLRSSVNTIFSVLQNIDTWLLNLQPSFHLNSCSHLTVLVSHVMYETLAVISTL